MLIIRPLRNFSLLGTDITLDTSKTYGAIPATNQPEWREKAKVFVGDLLLERGDYLIEKSDLPFSTFTDKPDHGSDPVGGQPISPDSPLCYPDGAHRMVPSGDIVSGAEKHRRSMRRLLNRPEVKNDCFGLSWDQIEKMQGGKLKR